jgi:hypothetical protein
MDRMANSDQQGSGSVLSVIPWIRPEQRCGHRRLDQPIQLQRFNCSSGYRMQELGAAQA